MQRLCLIALLTLAAVPALAQAGPLQRLRDRIAERRAGCGDATFRVAPATPRVAPAGCPCSDCKCAPNTCPACPAQARQECSCGPYCCCAWMKPEYSWECGDGKCWGAANPWPKQSGLYPAYPAAGTVHFAQPVGTPTIQGVPQTNCPNGKCPIR